MLAWPSNSCTARRSPLDCSRCDAKLWRSMCGCTCVGKPACARQLPQTRAHLAGRQPRATPADEQGRFVAARESARAAPSQARARAAAAPPTGTLRRLPPLPSTWALRSARSIQPRGLAPTRRRPAPPVRRCAGRSRTAARRSRGRARAARSSPASPAAAALLGQRHGLVDRQRLRQRLRRLSARAAHRPGCASTSPRWPHQRYSPRHADSTSAMLRGAERCARAGAATQRRTWCGCASRNVTPSACAAAACSCVSAARYSASVRAARWRSTARCCR